MQNLTGHIPVMPNEVLGALLIDPAGHYIDATYGSGGHSKLILDRLSQSGKLFAFDRDYDAIAAARIEHHQDSRVFAVHARFSQLKAKLLEFDISDQSISGIIADLGVSSTQLDSPERGFSFQHDGPLDFRMDATQGQTAAQWLQHVSEKKLIEVLRLLGEERFAKRIARNIVRQRKQKQILSTLELARLVEKSVPRREKHKHPATRTFMAIRMHINRELQELTSFLPQCVELLKLGGRLVVLTFHSIEDRIVKHFMRAGAKFDARWDGAPRRPKLKLIGAACKPSQQEVRRNRRARSATLRVAERVGC